MNESCRKLLVGLVAKRAANALSDHHSSANEKVDAYMCSFGIGWAEQMFRYASAHKMSQMIRGGLSNPSAKPFATQPRTDLHSVWFLVGGASSAEGRPCWVFMGKEGLTRGASREGWGEVLNHLEHGLFPARRI